MMQAALEGTIEVTSTNCLVVRMPYTSPPGVERYRNVDVAWPLGWSAGVREGTPVLIDADGQVVARLGDEVRVGGGFIEAARIGVVPCTGQEGRIFEAYELTRI
ncbi:hypothetical protein ACQHIV_01940 [Kribbella sp. GL6]|uniref:hypothetical protein n=1 Tax=Kribbella sp. GL6 TaxID=3419765 RepID=UPI003D05028B